MNDSLTCLCYEASGSNPYENIAREKVLMDSRKGREAMLYLWQNEHSIIIGRNQDAFAECRVEEFLAAGGRIARRYTGGGAVYHDLGNLNYTFIMPPDCFDIQRQMGVVCRALELAGVKGCTWSGRNDLLWNDRKCSGNAFQVTKTSGCHHGTLLLKTNMEPLLRFLTVSQSKLSKHGIQSVASRVVNLCDICPDLTLDDMKNALKQAFAMEYGPLRSDELKEEQQKLLEREAKNLQSPEWLYPDIPSDHELLCASYPWGEIRISMQVENGRIQNAAFSTDAMEADWFRKVSLALQNVNRKDASSAILSQFRQDTPEHQIMLNQIAELLRF